MASLIRRKNSPFWSVQFRVASGKWKRVATKFRVGIGTDTRKARELAANYSAKEAQIAPANNKEHWGEWVREWLAGLKLTPTTVDRYQAIWETVMEFLTAKEIPAPRYVTYATCMDYLTWRKTHIGHRRKPACHNTAILELKVLGFVMGEAVRRGFATKNPRREMRIGREKPREKPEFTDEQIAKIRAALKSEPEWMGDAFELAIHHGCRLSECRVPMGDVDLVRGVIHFRQTKGDKPFSVPIHPGVLPLLERKAATGAAFVADVPKNDSKRFHKLFRRLKLKGACFHSTRVTVVSRMARSEAIKPEVAMRYVNHSSELVHRIYQRLSSDDLRGVSAHLRIPSSESPGSPKAS